MKSIEIEEMRNIQLDILSNIDKICRENGIKYYLGYGSLIGAIRHKGFIPWDDDIDIIMMRNEYDKFLDLYSKQNNYPYVLYSHINKSDYPLSFAKIADERTLLHEDVADSYEIGINVDIFPLDTIPENKVLQNKMYHTYDIYHRLYLLKRMQWSEDKSIIKNVLILFSRFILKLIPYTVIARKLYNNAIKYEGIDSALCGNVVWGYGKREIARKEYFDSCLMREFEAREFPIPLGYDSYLKSIYGDYMQLPPKDMRISPHKVDACWLEL